jgi:phospholipid N-methyltransferase
MRYWTECKEFYQEFRRAYRNTGSILPSSRGLARALAWPFRQRQGPARVLEVGPGTGAVTDELLRQLRPGDHLDIVEINPHFVEVLRRRFETEPRWQSRKPQTNLTEGPLQDVSGTAVYDYMVSGLPLNNFPLALVRDIFHAYRRLLKPAGILSYFEYLAIRDIKSKFVSEKQRRHLRVLSRFLERRIRSHQVREHWVLLNVPPAVARHFCFSCTSNSVMDHPR